MSLLLGSAALHIYICLYSDVLFSFYYTTVCLAWAHDRTLDWSATIFVPVIYALNGWNKIVFVSISIVQVYRTSINISDSIYFSGYFIVVLSCCRCRTYRTNLNITERIYTTNIYTNTKTIIAIKYMRGIRVCLILLIGIDKFVYAY